MAEFFQNLMTNIKRHIHEARRTSSRINSQRYISRHIVVKMLKKKKEKILKAGREELLVM